MAGQVVRGERYFHRPRDEKKIWISLGRGDHLILLSPRRAGKTSMLRHLEDNPKAGFIFLYVMVQSCQSEQDVYLRILDKLCRTEFVTKLDRLGYQSKKWLALVVKYLKKIRYGKASLDVENSTSLITNTYVSNILSGLGLKETLVVVLDEYPDVLDRIKRMQGPEAAEQFLSNTRELCHEQDSTGIAQFVLTGSIGLDAYAKRLKMSNLINDKDKVHLTPLNNQEAEEFLRFLEQRDSIEPDLSGELITLIVEKVGWLMPYYIEILWESLVDIVIDESLSDVSINTIEQAYEALFEQKNGSKFSHWKERLNRFEKSEKEFANKVLNEVAENGHVTKAEMQNMRQDPRYKSVDTDCVIDDLIHDGYLFKNESGVFRFTSPLLANWWLR